MMSPDWPARAVLPRRILVVVDEPAFADVIGEALTEAGHTVEVADDEPAVRAALARTRFDAAIVDLDTRARNGLQLFLRIQALAPATLRIALLPCGGLPPGAAGVPFHLALEKPPRLAALVRAVDVARAVASN